MQDAKRLSNAAWLSQQYRSLPKLEGLSPEAAEILKAKHIVADTVSALESQLAAGEAKKQHIIEKEKKTQIKLKTATGQALQEDDTPTFFNDPFLDNGGFFKVCDEGCDHGEAHQACVAAGAELASIHSDDDVVEAAATCEGTDGSFLGEYFYWHHDGLTVIPDLTWSVPSFTRTHSTIDFNDGDFQNLGLHDHFVARWTGDISIVEGGTYTFQSTSDDGSKVYVGSKLVEDNDGLHGDKTVDGSIYLNPGYYPITVTFFERGGGAVCQVLYSGPDTADAATLLQAAPAPCYFGLERGASTLPWRYMDKSHVDFTNWQAGGGLRGSEYTKVALAPSTGLWTDAANGHFQFPAVCRKPPCHFSYFRGVPCPPEDFKPPAGSSPNTWPQIYRNLQNIDYCTDKYKHISLRIKCIKAFEPSNFLP